MMSDVKVKPMNDDNAKKKKTKTKMTSTATTARKSGGDVASLDDAWAKINSGKKRRSNDNDANGRGKDETTLEDVMMDVVMANNAKKIGNDNVKRTAAASLIMAQKSLFSADARDLDGTDVRGGAHADASSMEQMVNEANLTSYDTEMARMLSTFGSGSGSGGGNAFDQHVEDLVKL